MRRYFKIMVMGILLASLPILNSCGGGEGQNPVQSSKIKLYCDNAVYKLMKPMILDFDTLNLNIQVDLKEATAFDCMAKLFATETDAIIISRGYTSKEDSALKKYGLKPHLFANIAYDALVFYTHVDNKIDTIGKEQLTKLFTDNTFKFSNIDPKNSEYEFVCNNHLSSEFNNLREMILGGKKLEKYIKFFSTPDSVINYVLNNKQAIGIGYLSQVVRKAELKCIQVGFIDSTGKYFMPREVHQANIVRRFYPFRVTHRIMLLKENNEDVLALLRFLSRVGKVQKYFNESGIVPAFGDIRLQQEEE